MATTVTKTASRIMNNAQQQLTVNSVVVQQGESFGGSLTMADADNRYVIKSGDTMTGALNLPQGGLKVGSSNLLTDSSGRVGIYTESIWDSSHVRLHIGVASRAIYFSTNYGGYGIYGSSIGFNCSAEVINSSYKIISNAGSGEDDNGGIIIFGENQNIPVRLAIQVFDKNGLTGQQTVDYNPQYLFYSDKFKIQNNLEVTGQSYFTSHLSSNSFVSGFAGSGWRLTAGTNYDLEVDNLTVRKSMHVYELTINKIRSGNGSYWFSDGIKITNVIFDSDDGIKRLYRCYFDDDDGNITCPFVSYDTLRCQRWTGRDIRYWAGRVESVYNDFFVVGIYDYSYDEPASGDEVVRMGNQYDTSRQGAVYITSNDNNAPYIDVIDGVTAYVITDSHIKARLGKLTGITDSLMGTLSGYGLYSQNAYLRGKMVLPNAGMTDEGAQWSSIRIYAGSSYANRSTAPFRVSQDGSFVALNATISGRITATSGVIGGLNIARNYLYYSNSGISAISGSSEVRFWAGSSFTNRATAPFRVLDDGSVYAIKGYIAGFKIANKRIGVEGFDYDGMALYDDFVKFSSGTYVWSGIGTNVFPASAVMTCVARFENKLAAGLYTPVTSIYIDTAGGNTYTNDKYKKDGFSRAIWIARGDIYHRKGQILKFDEFYYLTMNSQYYNPIDVWYSQKWLIESKGTQSSYNAIYLPSLAQLQSHLGSYTNLSFEIYIKVRPDSTLPLRVYSNTTLYDQNGNAQTYIGMGKGDYRSFIFDQITNSWNTGFALY